MIKEMYLCEVSKGIDVALVRGGNIMVEGGMR